MPGKRQDDKLAIAAALILALALPWLMFKLPWLHPNSPRGLAYGWLDFDQGTYQLAALTRAWYGLLVLSVLLWLAAGVGLLRAILLGCIGTGIALYHGLPTTLSSWRTALFFAGALPAIAMIARRVFGGLLRPQEPHDAPTEELDSDPGPELRRPRLENTATLGFTLITLILASVLLITHNEDLFRPNSAKVAVFGTVVALLFALVVPSMASVRSAQLNLLILVVVGVACLLLESPAGVALALFGGLALLLPLSPSRMLAMLLLLSAFLVPGFVDGHWSRVEPLCESHGGDRPLMLCPGELSQDLVVAADPSQESPTYSFRQRLQHPFSLLLQLLAMGLLFRSPLFKE